MVFRVFINDLQGLFFNNWYIGMEKGLKRLKTQF